MWKYVKPEKKDFSALTRNTTLYGDYALFLAYNFEVFAHFFLDNIGYISYLRETMPISTRFLLADAQGESRTRLETIDAEFAKRVDWIECKKQDVCNQSVKIKNGTLTILQPVSSTRHMELLLKARKWILEKNPPKAQSLTDRKIVYYTRNSPNAYHGRKMFIEQERKIMQIIQEAMMEFGRNETLFVFNGTQTMQEQIDIFQSANIVIGAHGGGLSNLIFLLPTTSCDNRPKVLEFITNQYTPDIQRGTVGKTLFNLYSTCKWAKYYHIFYVPPSTTENTFVNLQDFQDAMQLVLNNEVTAMM